MPSDVSTTGAEWDLRRKVQELEQKLAEAHQREVATSEVLGVIATSPIDLQPVFQSIAERARQLCKAEVGATSRLEGDVVHLAGVRGPSAEAEQAMRAFFPVELQLAPANIRHALAQRAPFQIADVRLEPGYPDTEAAERMGVRSIVSVPLLHEGRAIGTIGVARGEPGRFSDETVALLQTFARQAVIAIENARLFEEVEASKRELQESLEYQTATSEVLSVISRSPSDLQPVLDVIVETAVRLCQAGIADFRLLRDGLYHIAATTVNEPTRMSTLRDNPIVPGRNSVVGRVALERRTVHVPDIHADPEYNYAPGPTFPGMRAILGVPLMREGSVIGVIVLFNSLAKPFSQKQIALITTFANQALIAIENTRLFEDVQARTKELQTSLDRQTATAEVLGVISRSPSQTQPVFDAIVATAARLCHAEYALIFKRESDERYHVAAANNAEAEWLRFSTDSPIPPGRGSLVGRTALEGKVVHIPDCLADPDFTFHASQRVYKFRTMLGVPLLRRGSPAGVIALLRNAVEPFSDTEIDLVTIFADQAVIAIENTRLFEEVQTRTRELEQSLQQQTATADVLKVISRSAFNLQAVLDALVKSAAELCGGDDVSILHLEADKLSRIAHYGPIKAPPGYVIPTVRGTIIGRSVLERRPIHVADLQSEAEDYPEGSAIARELGHRTILVVPLLREGTPLGVITVRRNKVEPFSDKQIDLVTTFADQAVIAIENTRLFAEVQARTSELAKTVEDLEIASQHKSQFVANMSHELRTPLAAILGYAELMQEGFYEPQGAKSLDALTRIRSNGKHLLGLINTVLDIAKIESGQFTLNMAEYAIESVVETVRSATESLAQNKKLALKTEVAKSLPIGRGDEQRLTQVLLNLVGNAIKFTDAGEVRVSATIVNSHFAVSVADTGPGIPEEHQARIFEQFHQVDSSNTKAKGGTGLGLAIAKQIVEMHGGRIWVESTPGKGSNFQMELPIRAEIRRGNV